MRLQGSDPIFSVGVDVMRPTFNLEPKHSVVMLTREEWNGGPGTPPEVKGLVWFTDCSRTTEGTRAVVYKHSLGRRLSISLGMYATVFQAEVNAILACVCEIQTQVRPEKSVSIRSDSQVALKALQIAKMMSPLVQLCQKALNNVSTQHTGAVLGPWTCWDTRKQNRREACKRRFRSL